MATISLSNIPTDAIPRIQFAVGRRLNLRDASNNPRNATAAEVEAELKRYLAAMVREQERAAAQEAIVLDDITL